MLKLKADPTFVAEVPVPIPGGRPANVKFTFKHRTKDDAAAFFEAHKDDLDVKFLMEIAVGWELSDAFNAENVAVLMQNYHGAARAIFSTYVTELAGARLGN
jgi:hypothetical protein